MLPSTTNKKRSKEVKIGFLTWRFKIIKIYFDFGTVGLDGTYEPFQARLDNWLHKVGYTEGFDCLSLKFEGEDHSEAAWQKR